MSDPDVTKQPEGDARGSHQQLVGMRWKVVMNGKNAANGTRYSATYTGDITEALDCSTIYDVMRDLAEHLEVANAEMEHPDSFQMTLYPQSNADIKRAQTDSQQPKR